MADKIIYARVKQRIDIESTWLASNPIILKGEIALVRFGDYIKFKFGDGNRRFNQIPYNVYDSPNFGGLATPGGSPGVLTAPKFWVTAQAGTYTNFGGVVLNANSIGFITYANSTFSISQQPFDLDYITAQVVTQVNTNLKATNAALRVITGSISALTKNDLSVINTTASDSDVNYINLFDNTAAVTYDNIRLKLAVGGNVIVVKSSADFLTITDIQTFVGLPAGISTLDFTPTALAIGERIGIRTIGTCKVNYTAASGVGFRSTKSGGTTFPNNEIGYTLSGPPINNQNMSQLTAGAASMAADISSLKGTGTTPYTTATNVALAAMTQTGGANTIYINQFPVLNIPQILTSFNIRQLTAGTITLYDYDEFNVQQAIIGTYTGTGGDAVVNIAASYNLKARHRIGFKSTTNMRYNTTGALGCFDVTAGVLNAGLELAFNYNTVNGFYDLSTATSAINTNAANVVTNTTDITALKAKTFPADELTLLTDTLATGANWTAVGWTLASNKFTSTGTGVTNRLNLNPCYHADKRSARFITTLSADSDLRIHCMYGTAALASGVGASMFGLNMTTNKFVFYTAAGADPNLTSTGVTSTVLTDFTIPFTLVAGRDYILEVEVDVITNRLRITDTLTGDTFMCENVGWLAGQQSQNYGFFVNSGGAVSIGKTDVRITIREVDYYIAGDSITKGEQVTNKMLTFGNLFRAINSKTVISARGGSKIDELILKLTSEVIFIKPKVMIVTIGINGGSTTAKIQQVVTFCATNGIRLVFNHIPCARSGDEHIAINALIDPFNLPKCYFDVATAKVNFPLIDGSHPSPRLNTSMYAADLTHLIESGHQACFNRFRLDLPYTVKNNS